MTGELELYLTAFEEGLLWTETITPLVTRVANLWEEGGERGGRGEGEGGGGSVEYHVKEEGEEREWNESDGKSHE